MDNESADRPAPSPSRRPRDLVRSLLVLLVPVLVLVGGYQLLSGRNEPVAVDQSAEISMARNAGLAAREPAGLDPAWTPVAADYLEDEGAATLRLGFVAPGGEPVQVVQTKTPAASLLPAELSQDATPGEPVDVAGVTWQRHPAGEETALVRRDGGLTVLVVGAATEQELTELAASLRGT